MLKCRNMWKVKNSPCILLHKHHVKAPSVHAHKHAQASDRAPHWPAVTEAFVWSQELLMSSEIVTRCGHYHPDPGAADDPNTLCKHWLCQCGPRSGVREDNEACCVQLDGTVYGELQLVTGETFIQQSFSTHSSCRFMSLNAHSCAWSKAFLSSNDSGWV